MHELVPLNNPADNGVQAREPQPAEGPESLMLDEAAIEAARRSLDEGLIQPVNAEWRRALIKLLNDALATELVCALRYRRHHFMAQGLASPSIAAEFMVHAQKESEHADRLAKRICQLGGEPDFSPDTLTQRSHADYDASLDLKQMIRADLVAERVAVESYSQMVALVGPRDPSTRRLLEQILSDEQEHADELQGWLGD